MKGAGQRKKIVHGTMYYELKNKIVLDQSECSIFNKNNILLIILMYSYNFILKISTALYSAWRRCQWIDPQLYNIELDVEEMIQNYMHNIVQDAPRTQPI